LFILQEQLNNNSNVVIELTSNEIIYGFKIKKTLFLFHDDHPITLRDDYSISSTNLFNKRLEFRAKAFEATTFANAKAKVYYNVRHQSLLLNLGDKVYLKLNHEYHLSSKSSKKLSPQRCDPFLVKKRIDRLAYLLELPSI
jgi:hypothetical protein